MPRKAGVPRPAKGRAGFKESGGAAKSCKPAANIHLKGHFGRLSAPARVASAAREYTYPTPAYTYHTPAPPANPSAGCRSRVPTLPASVKKQFQTRQKHRLFPAAAPPASPRALPRARRSCPDGRPRSCPLQRGSRPAPRPAGTKKPLPRLQEGLLKGRVLFRQRPGLPPSPRPRAARRWSPGLFPGAGFR